MSHRLTNEIAPRAFWLGILAACLAGGRLLRGQDVTAEDIKAARELWSKAGIRDYDLEYTTAPANGHFLVTVRDGEVKKVEAIQPDGARIELHPGAPRYYSVDGLFVTIADELAQLEKPNPFEQPKGTKVVMKFKTNPEARLSRVVSPRHHGQRRKREDRRHQAHTHGPALSPKKK